MLSGSKMMVQSDRLRAGEKWKQNKKKDDDDEKTQRSEEEKSEVISWKKSLLNTLAIRGNAAGRRIDCSLNMPE